MNHSRGITFSITSGSGTIYDANGVHLITSAPGSTPVPEPTMQSLFGVGLSGFDIEVCLVVASADRQVFCRPAHLNAPGFFSAKRSQVCIFPPESSLS